MRTYMHTNVHFSLIKLCIAIHIKTAGWNVLGNCLSWYIQAADIYHSLQLGSHRVLLNMVYGIFHVLFIKGKQYCKLRFGNGITNKHAWQLSFWHYHQFGSVHYMGHFSLQLVTLHWIHFIIQPIGRIGPNIVVL